MERPLTGKVAMVTGASRGIGRAIAVRLASCGGTVVVNYSQSRKAAEEVVREIEKNGGTATAEAADMGRVGEIEQLFATTLDRFGRLDILVNNAGIAVYKPIAQYPEEEFDRLFAVNVKGVFFACQQAARLMADGGRIINISSTVTRVMLPNYGAYAASKGAVDQITRVLAKELGSRGITVNAISPGPIDTTLFRRGKTEDQIASMAAMSAFHRIGTVDDIADCVELLVSEKSGWITGQNICANGGFAA